MRKNTIKGETRKKTGTKNSKRLRRNGYVPCVLYGGDEVLHVAVDRIRLEKLLYAPYVNEITIDIEGDKRKTIIQSAQFHPVTDNLFHVDLLEISEDIPVTVDVPVNTIGIPEGVKTGGRLRVNFSKIPVKAIPSKIPESLDIEVEHLQVGDIVRIQDLPFKELNFMRQPERVVVAVKALADLEEIEAELAEAEAEIESEKEDKEEADEDAEASEEESAGGEEEGGQEDEKQAEAES